MQRCHSVRLWCREVLPRESRAVASAGQRSPRPAAGDHAFLRHRKLEFGFDLLGLEIFVENRSQNLGAGTADQSAKSAGSHREKWEGLLEEFVRGKVS
jgi:hypothetical protein